MNYSCNDTSCSYKNISVIIQSANLLNVEDPATYIRNHTKSNFKITEEECAILERMRVSQDMTEYKQYLLHYLNTCSYIHITCPNCDYKIHCSLSVVPPSADAVRSADALRSADAVPCADAVRSKESICCSNYMINKIHDPLCMYYKEN